MGLGDYLKRGAKLLGRGAAAYATGGASEAYRAKTGKADPYTKYQENLAGGLANKVNAAIGESTSGPNPYGNGAETLDERKQRALSEGDEAVARSYRDRLAGMDTGPRVAPQVGAPAPVTAAHVGSVAPISAGAPIVAQRVGSTFDRGIQDESQGLQRAYLDRAQSAMDGNVPSAGEIALRRGGAAAASLASSLASGHKGYGGAGLRNAQRVGAATMQQSTAAAAQMKADEMARARTEYGNAVTAVRGQDLGLAQTAADFDLRAAQGNQQTGLQADIASRGLQMDAARANQAADLQKNLTQAGLDQSAILHMSDQQLQVALSNAGYKLSQQQIDDLRAHNQHMATLEANGQVLGADAGQAQRQQQLKQLRAQYALAVQQNDQKGQDAALAAMADFGAAYASGGTSLAGAGAGGGTGSTGSLAVPGGTAGGEPEGFNGGWESY